MILLDKRSREPYYQQVSDGIRKLIESGFFSHGKKLPTLIELKDILNVSLKVVAQAYDDLSQKGFIYSRRGKGYYVESQVSFEVDLNEICDLESQLIFQLNMKRHILLFESIVPDDYVRDNLKLNKDEECYHILQYYGRNHKNALIQEIYLPKRLFPKLHETYEKHLTLKHLIERGYNYSFPKALAEYYSSSTSRQEELFLGLQANDPIWKIVTICKNKEDNLAMVNYFMSGNYVTLAVLLDVN